MHALAVDNTYYTNSNNNNNNFICREYNITNTDDFVKIKGTLSRIFSTPLNGQSIHKGLGKPSNNDQFLLTIAVLLH